MHLHTFTVIIYFLSAHTYTHLYIYMPLTHCRQYTYVLMNNCAYDRVYVSWHVANLHIRLFVLCVKISHLHFSFSTTVYVPVLVCVFLLQP